MIHEFSVSCACTENTPSAVEICACSASSIWAIGSAGLGSAIVATPRRLISSPSCTSTVSAAMAYTREKLVKLMPAANQIAPRSGGNTTPSSSSAPIGSCASDENGSSASTRMYVCTWSIVGAINRRFTPMPPPRPVTKNAGGPPIGATTAPKPKNETYSPPAPSGKTP